MCWWPFVFDQDLVRWDRKGTAAEVQRRNIKEVGPAAGVGAGQ